MSKVKSDIEIARKAKMKPISKILAKINVPDKSSAFSPMGRHIAKINFEFLEKLKMLLQILIKHLSIVLNLPSHSVLAHSIYLLK